jgi:hypothetical protein
MHALFTLPPPGHPVDVTSSSSGGDGDPETEKMAVEPLQNPFAGATVHAETDQSGLELDLSWSSNAFVYAFGGRRSDAPPLPPLSNAAAAAGGGRQVVGSFANGSCVDECCGAEGAGGLCCEASHALMFAKMHRVALQLQQKW